MGLFGLFGGSKSEVEVDNSRNDGNKKRMRELFDSHVEDGSSYQIVYAYSEDIQRASLVVIRTFSCKFRSFVIGYRESDLSLVFLEVSPDLSQAGEPYTYKPQDVKRVNFIKMTGAYYLQYGNSFKKEFFNFFVPKYVDEILNNDWYDEETFAYVDQRDEHSSWVEFWNHFCSGR